VSFPSFQEPPFSHFFPEDTIGMNPDVRFTLGAVLGGSLLSTA
jgi:hypothetical protein